MRGAFGSGVGGCGWVLMAALALGCSRSEANGGGSQAAATPAAAPVAGAGAAAQGDEDRDRRRRFRDALVFVDGQPAGVLKFRELPPGLAPTLITYSPTKHAVRFSVWNYVASLGVDMARLKEVHLHGGRARASVLPRAVLEKYRNTLTIQFTQQVTGKPSIKWPDDFAEPVTPLDIITEVSVYVDREPPRWSPEDGAYRMPDGTLRSGVPFAAEKDVGGTRLYRDGKLVTFLRRPQEGDREAVRDLAAAVKEAGVDLATVVAVDLVDEDRPTRVALAEVAPGGLGFSFPSRSQGRMKVHVRSEGAAPREAMVSAVQLWSTPGPHGVTLPPEVLAEPAVQAALGLGTP